MGFERLPHGGSKIGRRDRRGDSGTFIETNTTEQFSGTFTPALDQRTDRNPSAGQGRSKAINPGEAASFACLGVPP